MHLEISEHTQERQTVVTVGTSMIRGEDLPAQGRIYVFNVIKVVPEPDRPETGHKLKLIAKEEVKGAVTALSEIGTQGFLLAAQGQKCMVRGLKEDGTLLPVAFMDMQCYTSVVKELKGTGMCLMGDVVKGCWFAGYFVSHASFSSSMLLESQRADCHCRRNPTNSVSSANPQAKWKFLRRISSPMAETSTSSSQMPTQLSTSCNSIRNVR